MFPFLEFRNILCKYGMDKSRRKNTRKNIMTFKLQKQEKRFLQKFSKRSLKPLQGIEKTC
ncbi:unnamed protein product [Ceutorhynchus assimilis]|uniref:Uncharacterized protein n=1 Tax=Ceutorhynchus assimilis TaxID=467358 RepID=A0A9N9QI02_9CUCU|nr:unnamed protein product [Ceutorhynchus assimilis]